MEERVEKNGRLAQELCPVVSPFTDTFVYSIKYLLKKRTDLWSEARSKALQLVAGRARFESREFSN